MNNDAWIWTAPQRRALLVVIFVLLAALAYRAWRNGMYVGETPPAVGPRAGELADGVDPNRASVAELAALPEMGLSRAGAIVEYREHYVKEHPGKRAFEKVADLTHVKGIASGTAAGLAPYLIFSNGATRPAE